MPGIEARAPGAHRDEQRRGGIAERLAGDAPDMGEAGLDLIGEIVRVGLVVA